MSSVAHSRAFILTLLIYHAQRTFTHEKQYCIIVFVIIPMLRNVRFDMMDKTSLLHTYLPTSFRDRHSTD